MRKGERTKQAILDHAMQLSSEVGLEALSIGGLAKRAGLSKSGLYAHFDTKETLQCEVLDNAAARWLDVVLTPALKAPRGVPRLEALFEQWIAWERDELDGGCPFIAAGTEFDDRPGPVRDCLKGHLRDMLGAVGRAAEIAVEEGHLRADLDTDQLAFELWGALLAYHHYRRLLDADDAGARARRALASMIAAAA